MDSRSPMKKEINMMRSFTFAILLATLPSVVLAQGGATGLPCSPCKIAGGCGPKDPILSFSAHKCQNHSFHNHSGATIGFRDQNRVQRPQVDVAASRRKPQ